MVGEPCTSEELDRFLGGPQPLQEVEFEGLPEDGGVSATGREADGTVTVVEAPEQMPTAPAVSEQDRAPARHSDVSSASTQTSNEGEAAARALAADGASPIRSCPLPAAAASRPVR